MATRCTFEILPGLPGDGDPPAQFSASGQGMHREGLVVAFDAQGQRRWIANFQPGASSFSAVQMHPDGIHFLVISGGQAYLVDPVLRRLENHFGGSIEGLTPVPESAEIVLSNGLWLELHDEDGLKWKTRRVSWDGIKNLEVGSNQISGEGWCFDETWHPFIVELASGRAEGGGYYESEP